MSTRQTLQWRRTFLEMAVRRAQPGSGSSLEFLLARTWSEPRVDLRTLQTPFVVVGAVATALYMPERTTSDVDILILPTDAARIAAELSNAGCILQDPLSIGGTRWVDQDGDLLVVLESHAPWAPLAIEHPNRSPTGLPVITLPYLVLMKLAASRGQDLADLTRMLGMADESTRADVREAVRQFRPTDLGDVESLIALGELELQE